MLLTAQEFLRENPGQTDELAIREAISGVICRCTGYQQIVEAIQSVAATGMTIEQLPAAARIATETALKEAGKRRWLGKSINRVEDPRFLRGEGRYIDDISLPGMAHAAIVRSPHAHARIVSIDTSKARARCPASSVS